MPLPPATTTPPPVVQSAPPVVDLSGDETPDYFTKRYEPAGFPLIGGDSDIGAEFGGVLTLTRFADGTRPYAWNMDIVLTASVKNVANGGLGIAQQSYLWQWDVPGLAGGRLRLNPMVQFRKTINQGYFGVGNASNGVRPAGVPGSYFQYIHEEGGARQVTRYVLAPPIDLMFSTTLRYIDPGIYAGSRLAADTGARAPNGSPLLSGVEALGILGQAAGFVYDTRDSEIFTHSGGFHQVGVRFAQATPDTSIRYGEAGAILSSYTPVGPLVLAMRGVVDLEFGKVPFYDLYEGGVFVPDEMPGGSAGIRGVPEGRYLGPIKVVGNVELRTMWLSAHLLGQSFHLGNGVFFDTGRVWSDYTFRSPLDGSGLGLKWGAGAGAYLLWGQAAIFRLEVAYSPDAEAENPGFPLGVYVQDGVMF